MKASRLSIEKGEPIYRIVSTLQRDRWKTTPSVEYTNQMCNISVFTPLTEDDLTEYLLQITFKDQHVSYTICEGMQALCHLIPVTLPAPYSTHAIDRSA